MFVVSFFRFVSFSVPLSGRKFTQYNRTSFYLRVREYMSLENSVLYRKEFLRLLFYLFWFIFYVVPFPVFLFFFKLSIQIFFSFLSFLFTFFINCYYIFCTEFFLYKIYLYLILKNIYVKNIYNIS